MIEEFERHLRGTNLSENTKASYLFAVRQYNDQYGEVTQKNLRAYKVWLIENYKPKTVNLRLRAINCYLESVGKEKWKLPFVRVQQKAFLENVISEADYEYFKNCLKRDNEMFWYFVIRFLAATGARVSELIQIKVEHIKLGHLDLYSKGGKLRRIYIPKALQDEALSWLAEKQQETGFIFLNKYGERITTRGISGQLKKLAVRYEIDPVIRTLSAIALLKASWSGAMILRSWLILWDTRVSKLLAFICGKPLLSSKKSLIRLLTGDNKVPPLTQQR